MLRALIALSIALLLAGCAAPPGVRSITAPKPPDARLADIAAQLHALHRGGSEQQFEPPFFVARDILRDWIEARLTRETMRLDAARFTVGLNRDLDAAKLFCRGECESRPAEFDATGYIGEIDAKRIDDYFMVKTHLGIVCGYADTGYLYHWQDGGWVRLWQSAQDPDADGSYAAETIDSILYNFSRDDFGLVATAGYSPWCTSNWRTVSYRLWTLPRPRSRPMLAVDEKAFAYIGGEDGPLGASLRLNRFVVVYHAASLDPAVHNRLVVRHFRIDGDGIRRAPPYALTPRDFVEEWLTREWSFSSVHTTPGAHDALQIEYARWHAEDMNVDFLGPTHACDGEQGWEVGIDFHRPAEGKRVFRVVKAPASDFHIAGVGTDYTSGCMREAPQADETSGAIERMPWFNAKPQP